MIELCYRFTAASGDTFLVPQGMTTPHVGAVGQEVTGAALRLVGDPRLSQMLTCGVATGGEVQVSTRFQVAHPEDGFHYPEAVFVPRASRYTAAASDLATECRHVAKAAGAGLAGLEAIVRHVAEIFEYGHPEDRFYDDRDELPHLCSMTIGSCVDINAYLVAALRGAGYEAGYVYGVFVPQEKRSWAQDGHCWVVSRHAGQTQEWDIAHFLKMGRRDIGPALNPRPGVRVPMAHSMGWSIPELGIQDFKLMGPPLLVSDGGEITDPADLEITLSGYEALEGQ